MSATLHLSRPSRARLAVRASAVALLVGCGGVPPGAADAAPWWADAGPMHDALSAADASEGDYVPYLAGEFRRVYTPMGTRYLNDHTIVRGPDGRWHVYGITQSTLGTPQKERVLLHATAPSLLGPWSDAADILDARDGGEEVLWAPFVIDLSPRGPWAMYYWGGTSGSTAEPPRGLYRADSADLDRWVRRPGHRVLGGRDAFVYRDGANWLLYSVGVDADARGQIIVSASATPDDPDSWSAPEPVITDPLPNFPWGNVESPFVVRYAGSYYLFVTRTGPVAPGAHPVDVNYDRTYVFRSSSLTRFDWRPITELRAHAAEVVEADGRYFLTSAGWTGLVGEASRGLSLAPLQWARQ